MGCVVNGPGEAKDCDLGIAGAEDYCVIFKNGKIIRLPRQLFGLELGSSTLVVLFYFGQ